MNGRFLFQTIVLLLVLQIVVSCGCRRHRRKNRCHRNRDCCLPGYCCDDDCCCDPPRHCCRYKPRKSHRCRSRCYAADDDCCCCERNKCATPCCSPQKSGDTIIITGNNRPGCNCGCCQSPIQSPAVCGCGCQPVSNPWSYGGIGCGQCEPLCNNGQGKTTIVIKEPTQTIPCC